jgi:hypothetical protein
VLNLAGSQPVDVVHGRFVEKFAREALDDLVDGYVDASIGGA